MSRNITRPKSHSGITFRLLVSNVNNRLLHASNKIIIETKIIGRAILR
jgi:hypothetical protein